MSSHTLSVQGLVQEFVPDGLNPDIPWVVETGKGTGKYTRRFEFESAYKAIMYYNGLHTHSGYKKRLRHNGKVVARVIT